MNEILLFLVVAVLVIWCYRWLSLPRVCEPSPPVVLDRDNPRDVHESKVIDYQNTLGRERNSYKWIGD